MHSFADGIEIVILVFEYLQFYFFLRILSDDSSGLVLSILGSALYYFFLMCGQFREHFLVFLPVFFVRIGFGGGLFCHSNDYNRIDMQDIVILI